MNIREILIPLFIVIIIILSIGASGEWNKEKRLTYSGVASCQSAVLDEDNNLHIFYQERDEGNAVIRYTKLDPMGKILIYHKTVCRGQGDTLLPTAMVLKNEIHLLFYGETMDGYRLYHALLNLNGTHLRPDVALTDITNRPLEAPRMSTDGNGRISVAWAQKGTTSPKIISGGALRSEVYVMKIGYDGNILMPPLRISTAYGNGIYPDVAVDRLGRTVVIWSEDITGNYEIYFTTISGRENPEEIERRKLTSTPGESVMGKLLLLGGEIYITWSEGERDNSIYMIHLGIIQDASLIQNWRISTKKGNAFNPYIASDGRYIYVVWQDDRNTLEGSSGRDAVNSAEENISGGESYVRYHLLGEERFDVSEANNWEIYLSVVDGEGAIIENNTRTTKMPRASVEPVICIDSHGTKRLVWRDMVYSSGDLFYRDELHHHAMEDETVVPKESRKIVVVGGIGILVLVYFLMDEGRRYLILRLAAFPLYSTIRRDRLMDNKHRRTILSLINSHHGITFSALMREVGLKNGALAYHLYTLEREHYIKSVKDGKYRRFYPRGSQVSAFSSLQEKILSIIMENPLITQREIADRIESTPQTVNYNIRKLRSAGIVSLKKEGKYTRCYISRKSRAV